MARSAQHVCLLGILILCSAGVARAETFLLAQGGQISGELQNPNEAPRQNYVIKTSDGATITLARDQVKQVVRRRPAEIEYEQIRHRYPDTVEGQWSLAEWCRENVMSAQRKAHLQRVIELDPKHEQARRALGYIWKNGEWITRQELMEKDGRVWYRGKWRLPQEIELIEEANKLDAQEKEWVRKIELWREQLGTDKTAAAEQSIRSIKDPLAAKGLKAALTASENRAARTLFIKALISLGTPEAKETVAACSLADPDEEVRLTCLDFLRKERDPRITEFYVGRLRDSSNLIVNRAAFALGKLGDKSAVNPLIDALVTIHKRKIEGDPNRVNAGFGTGGTGGGGMTVGGGPKIIREPIQNRAALEALQSLTGVNYAFDVRAWKRWYASQKQTSGINARRGS